jgi:hypothetical protein
MDDKLTKLLFDPNGPWGWDAGFLQNAIAEVGGFFLGAIVFSIFIPIVIDWRQARKWQPARLNFGQELLLLHVAFGEAVLRYARMPVGAARMRAADLVDNAFRAFPALTGLFGYALTADISREVNDYMRVLRSVRDWVYEAAHPDDLGFAVVERRVKRTRDMFEEANKEFKDVLDELGVNGFDEVRWSREMVDELAAAFDASHAKAR